jgi:hypothetical protein
MEGGDWSDVAINQGMPEVSIRNWEEAWNKFFLRLFKRNHSLALMTDL